MLGDYDECLPGEHVDVDLGDGILVGATILQMTLTGWQIELDSGVKTHVSFFRVYREHPDAR